MVDTVPFLISLFQVIKQMISITEGKLSNPTWPCVKKKEKPLKTNLLIHCGALCCCHISSLFLFSSFSLSPSWLGAHSLHVTACPKGTHHFTAFEELRTLFHEAQFGRDKLGFTYVSTGDTPAEGSQICTCWPHDAELLYCSAVVGLT